MYLIKHPAEDINAQRLKENDVISIGKKWFIIREELGLEDKLKLTKLRDGKKYTIVAIKSFGCVSDFRKIGVVIEDRWVEDLSVDVDEENTKEEEKEETTP